MKFVVCKSCNWISFTISRKEAERAVKRFNLFFKTLTLKQRKEYYNNIPSNIKLYEMCASCGGSYKNFRACKRGDFPDGSTAQAIIKGTG